MTTETDRVTRRKADAPRPLLPAVLAAGTGAYLIPAVTTAVNALVIPDPAVADRLAFAAWTTLGVPSALAAMAATAWFHFRTPPARPSAATTVRAFLTAALVAALLSGAVTAVLIGNGLLDLGALQFTLSAAAMGAGITARRWARTHRRSS